MPLQRNEKQTWRCLGTGADFEAQASAAAQPAPGPRVVILGEAESARSLCLSLPPSHSQDSSAWLALIKLTVPVCVYVIFQAQ